MNKRSYELHLIRVEDGEETTAVNCYGVAAGIGPDDEDHGEWDLEDDDEAADLVGDVIASIEHDQQEDGAP